MSLQKLIDMKMTPEETAESMMPSVGSYPYGLSICLCQDELEKLEVSHEDCEVGDIYDLRAMCKVTSVSENEDAGGKRCRVELQIIMLGVESESDEADEEEKPAKRARIRYKG